MAVQIRTDNTTDITAPPAIRVTERERRLLESARRRRLARMRRNAETAAWVIGSLALAVIAVAGLVGVR